SSERNSAERSANLTTEEESIIAGETIAAISTPAGEGAIALVRVAGPDAIAVADKVFRGKEEPSRFASHLQHFGEIFDRADRLIFQKKGSHRMKVKRCAGDSILFVRKSMRCSPPPIKDAFYAKACG